jgi:hypothetical protein
MGKRQELELEAIRRYAAGEEIPAISEVIGVSENSLRKWKQRAGTEWQDARKAARQSRLASMEDVGKRIRRSQEITAQLLGDAKSQSGMGLVLNQALQTSIYDLIGQIQTLDVDDEDAINTALDRVNLLTLALGRLETAAFRNNKTVAEIRKQALVDAADAVEKQTDTLQLKPETLDYIKKVIYGLSS